MKNVPLTSIRGADRLLKECGSVRPGEQVLIVCDPSTRDVGDLLLERAWMIARRVQLCEVPELSMHGQEPPPGVADQMSQADLCIGLTAKSMAHTEARRRAAAHGCRYLSLPEYSLELLAAPALLADFRGRSGIVKTMAHAFTCGQRAEASTGVGTSVLMNIQGRVGNCCPGFVSAFGELGSPPDIEANVSPVETDSEGVVVVDGSVPYPGLGKLSSCVTLYIEGGRIVKIEAEDAIWQKLHFLFTSVKSDKVYVLAECGVGLNDMAVLNGTMLMDEGAYGTMHFGFGSNFTVGGLNKVPFHLDFVFKAPTLKVDGKILLKDGELQI